MRQVLLNDLLTPDTRKLDFSPMRLRAEKRQGDRRNRRIIHRQFVELLFYGQSPATRAKSTTAKAKIANSPVIAKTFLKMPKFGLLPTANI